jgi:glutaconate CoA-transferase subunit B
MTPDEQTKELTVTSLHPGVTVEQVREATGWPVRVADALSETPPPTSHELDVLRDLQRRTEAAHQWSQS